MSNADSQSVLRRIVDDHRKHRPSSFREAVWYFLELWAAMGLWYRGALFYLIWGLYRDEHGYEKIRPDHVAMDWGLTAGPPLDRSVIEDPVPDRVHARIDLGIALGTIALLVHLKMGINISNWLVFLLIWGPSIVYVCCLPLWPAVAELAERWR